jgi:hypothetical protein
MTNRKFLDRRLIIVTVHLNVRVWWYECNERFCCALSVTPQGGATSILARRMHHMPQSDEYARNVQ